MLIRHAETGRDGYCSSGDTAESMTKNDRPALNAANIQMLSQMLPGSSCCTSMVER
jgi:hypothetical protein